MWWMWLDQWFAPSRLHEVIHVDFKRRRILARVFSE